MIKQIGLPLRGCPILLITRMITDRIGLHSVLLPLQISNRILRRRLSRRNLTPVYSNVCEAVPILVLGPQQTQRITRNAFQNSLQPDWQIDNCIFTDPDL